MALFTWPFPKSPSSPPLLGVMALAVAAAAAILLAAGLFNLQVNLDARQVSLEAPTAQAQSVAQDRAALVALYTATNGASWTTSTNWNSNEPLGNWHGVTTNRSGRVTVLRLGGNNLTGSIPPELGDLTDLTELTLFNNNLTGSIPPELGNLSNLRTISLRDNNLTGSIPPELGQLSTLRELSLFNNSLTGTVPAELGNLSILGFNSLHLSGNQLTGQLPLSLTRLERVDTLNFEGNAGLCAPLDSDFRTWFDGIVTKTGDDCPRTRIWTATAGPVVGEPVTAELTAREDRLARIEATLDDYNSDPCIGYDDTRSVRNRWRWQRAPAPTGPFTTVKDTELLRATFAYPPQADDVGMYLRANVTVDGTRYNTDAIGPVMAEHGVASGDQVAAAAPAGTLTVGNNLSVSLPAADAAERHDPAINPRVHPWQWERSEDGSTDWTNVTPYHKHCETPEAQYPLAGGDANKHLRGYVYYNDDSSGSSVLKRAETASVGPVAP